MTAVICLEGRRMQIGDLAYKCPSDYKVAEMNASLSYSSNTDVDHLMKLG